MNARLDYIVPTTAANQAPSLADFACCRRYSPANDQAPEILGIALDVLERATSRVAGSIGTLLRRAASSRQ